MSAQSSLTLHQRGPDTKPFDSRLCCLFPGAFGPCTGLFKLANPQRVLGETSSSEAFPFMITRFCANVLAPPQCNVVVPVVTQGKRLAEVHQNDPLPAPIFWTSVEDQSLSVEDQSLPQRAYSLT